MKHLKKLKVHADEDSDAHFPAPPPKRKAAGLASGVDDQRCAFTSS